MSGETSTDRCIQMPEIPPFAAQVKSGYEMMLALGFPAVAPKLSREKSYSPKVMKSHESVHIWEALSPHPSSLKLGLGTRQL
jgi:hypothetical protein